MIITNSGCLRADLYAGPFTRDDQFIVSPFTDSYEYLESIPYSVANRILDELNHSGLPSRRKRGPGGGIVEGHAFMNQDDSSATYEGWVREQWDRWNMEQRGGANLTLGYVTEDVSDFLRLEVRTQHNLNSGMSGCGGRRPTCASAILCYPAFHRLFSGISPSSWPCFCEVHPPACATGGQYSQCGFEAERDGGGCKALHWRVSEWSIWYFCECDVELGELGSISSAPIICSWLGYRVLNTVSSKRHMISSASVNCEMYSMKWSQQLPNSCTFSFKPPCWHSHQYWSEILQASGKPT